MGEATTARTKRCDRACKTKKLKATKTERITSQLAHNELNMLYENRNIEMARSEITYLSKMFGCLYGNHNAETKIQRNVSH